MSSHNAYCNYTAAYNGFARTDLPRLSAVGDFTLQAEQLQKSV